MPSRRSMTTQHPQRISSLRVHPWWLPPLSHSRNRTQLVCWRTLILILSLTLTLTLTLMVTLTLTLTLILILVLLLTAGARCFGGMTPSCGGDCSGAPLLPIAYVGLNLLFNISALLVLRTSGEAQACHTLPEML